MADSRAAAITRDLIAAFKGVVEKHDITQDEYRAGVMFVAEAAEQGEIMLLPDAFLESIVVAHHSDRQQGTHAQVLGPYHLDDSRPMENGRLAAEDEPGDRLVVRGTVRDPGGEPLAGATLDIWQADADGRYSGFHPDAKPGNLRGRTTTGDDGSFEIHTVVPAPYMIPHRGPTGRLLELLGRHPWRPAHIHLIASREGYRTLTTQVYFEGDPYLDSDSVTAARPELAFPLQDADDGKSLAFDVTLEPMSGG